jgi:hypothetical protein
LTHPCTWRAPARTPSSEQATASPLSLWVWMPTCAPGNAAHTVCVIAKISCGRQPPLVSQSTTPSAPSRNAA